MKILSVDAPGKVILHGEHAVVYGKKAIACAVNARVQVDLFQTEKDVVSIFLPNVPIKQLSEEFDVPISLLKQFSKTCFPEKDGSNNIEKWSELLRQFALIICPVEEKNNNLFVTAFSVLIFAYLKIFVQGNHEFPAFAIRITSGDLPVGSGLGSSAAFCVSLATAFLLHAKKLQVHVENDCQFDDESLKRINDMALSMEKLLHGNPSGIDNTVSTYGGALTYVSGNKTRFKKFPKLDFLIVNTATPRSTKLLVSSVKKRNEKFPELMKLLLQSFNEITETAEDVLIEMSETSDQNRLSALFEKQKELMKMNQHLLNCIGVGHSKLDEICRLSDSLGFASKLTGAGGGGCAIILLNPEASKDKVEQLEKGLDSKFSYWKTVLGCEGVRVTYFNCDHYS